MRCAIGLLSAAIMLLTLAAVTGSPPAHAGAPPRIVRVQLGGHPHPCTPYAGCAAVDLSAYAGSTAP
ncbi:MAG TPA: hypothetical protein VHL51_10335 [Gaiellales bacterium]|jgi:hypothetical protein|nr:hypothetical protein [Gaiellales bacterium]